MPNVPMKNVSRLKFANLSCIPIRRPCQQSFDNRHGEGANEGLPSVVNDIGLHHKTMIGFQQRQLDQSSDKRKQWRYLCSNCSKNGCKLFECAKCKIVSCCSKKWQSTIGLNIKSSCIYCGWHLSGMTQE